MPKISIIAPVYNMSKYLQQCLDSVLSQSLKDIEIICINDGSTDNSLEILNCYAKKDSRIIVMNKKNEGQGVARNEALKVAKGEYILFLDPDDWLEGDALEKMYTKITNDDGDILVFNVYKYCDFEKKDFIKHNYVNPYYVRFKDKVFSPKEAKDILFAVNALPFKLYKHSKLKEWGFEFSNHRYIEDHLAYFVAFSNADRISVLNESLLNYRQHKKSTTENASKKNILDIFEITYMCEKALQKSKYGEELIPSFIDNRVGAIWFYHFKTSWLTRLIYYRYFRKFLKYVREKYGENLINQGDYSFKRKLIIKHKSYLLFYLEHGITLTKILLKTYFFA